MNDTTNHSGDSLRYYLQSQGRVKREPVPVRIIDITTGFQTLEVSIRKLGETFSNMAEVWESWNKNLIYEQCKRANVVREHFIYQKFDYEHLEHQVNIRIAALNIAFSEYLDKIYKS